MQINVAIRTSLVIPTHKHVSHTAAGTGVYSADVENCEGSDPRELVTLNLTFLATFLDSPTRFSRAPPGQQTIFTW